MKSKIPSMVYFIPIKPSKPLPDTPASPRGIVKSLSSSLPFFCYLPVSHSPGWSLTYWEVPVSLKSCSPSGCCFLLVWPLFPLSCLCHHYQKTSHLQNVTLLLSAVSQNHCCKLLELIKTVVLLLTTMPPPCISHFLAASPPLQLSTAHCWNRFLANTLPFPVLQALPCMHLAVPQSLVELHHSLVSALASAAVLVLSFQIFLCYSTDVL